MNTQKCIVCNTDNTSSQFSTDDKKTFYNCKRCGKFVSGYGIGTLTNQDRSALSHWIRKQQVNIKIQSDGKLNNPDISDIINERLRSKYSDILDNQILIQEKMDSIIFKIGEMSKFAGDTIVITKDNHKEIAAFSGCVINFEEGDNLEKEYFFLIQNLKDNKLFSITSSQYCQLTKDGVEKYQQLQNQINNSKRVFMAMKFDQDKNKSSYCAKHHLEIILEEKFNLELFSMEHNNQLGNIIEVMKAEINDAKFIICDLSDGNRGAYWEAGYAEGQKKKVIYICDEKVFSDEELNSQDKERKIHFDIKQTRIIKFDFSSEEKIQIFKKEIESSIKANGLNI